jgi:hypothetical protein
MSGSRWRIALALALATTPTLAAPRIESATPNRLPYGHAQTVRITVAGTETTTQLALSPGGPFIKATLDLAAAIYVTPVPVGDHVLAVTPNALVLLDGGGDARGVERVRLTAAARHAAADESFLVVADARRRLQLFDLRRPGLPRIEVTLTVPHAVVDLFVSEEVAHVLGEGGVLYRVDLAAAKPQLLELGRVDAGATLLRVHQATCFLAGADIGLLIADCSGGAARTRARFVTSGTIRDLRIDDGVAFIADGSAGLALLDVTNLDQPALLGSNNKLGDVYRVATDAGGVMVANTRGELILVDVTRATLPLAAARIRLARPPRALAWRDGDVWAASEHDVQRIDFTDESAPLLSDEGVNLGGSRRGFIDGDILYVADWFSGLHLYDVSNPKRLRHVGNFHTPGSSKGVVVRDGYAYVGDDDHGLQIIDVRDPGSPALVGNVLTPGLAYTMKLIGDRLYLADHRGGLHIVDVGDVRRPRILGGYDTPGKAWAVDVRDHVAFVADDQSGLLVFDVRDPARIELIGQFAPGGLAEDVRLRDRFAFVTFFDQGLYVLDVSDPRRPTPVSHVAIPGNARGVELQGNYAFVAAWEAGLQIVDIGDPAQPRIVGYHDTDGSVWGVNVRGGFAYALDWWGGVKTIDVTSPSRPQPADRYHARTPLLHLALADRFVLAAAGDGGVQIFDVRNPLNPIWVTGVDVPGAALALATDADNAYVATSQGLAVIDLRDPFGARLSRVIPGKNLTQVHAAGGRVMVRDAAGTVYECVRCREPAPTWRSLAMEVDDVWAADDALYLARGRHGVSVLSLRASSGSVTPALASARPAHRVRAHAKLAVTLDGNEFTVYTRNGLTLTPRATQSTHGAIRDAQLIGDALYLTTEHDELLAFDLIDPGKPTLRSRYRGTQTIEQFVVRDGQAFFAGAPKLASLKFLPEIRYARVDDQTFTAEIPAGLPLGSYDLSAWNADGKTAALHNAITVAIRTGRKPSMTPEQFERLRQQQH